MAKSSNRQLRQIRALGVVMTLILAAIGYLFRDKFLPTPKIGAELTAQKHVVNLPRSLPETIYSRPDFEALREFGSVPVRPLPAPSSDPFAPPPLIQ